MALTSMAIPFVATWHWLRGLAGLPARQRRPGPQATTDRGGVAHPPAAVLFDRDGTLVHDVPYNGDPELVDPVDDATDVLERLRALGVPTALVTNQSGVARGLITEDDVEAVNARLDEVLGGLGPHLHCPHGPGDGCGCRKPAPGMVVQAAEALGVDPAECVVIGDTGADVEAALAAGARPILVPNDVTRREEVAAAPEVADDLAQAVEMALAGPVEVDEGAMQRVGGMR